MVGFGFGSDFDFNFAFGYFAGAITGFVAMAIGNRIVGIRCSASRNSDLEQLRGQVAALKVQIASHKTCGVYIPQSLPEQIPGPCISCGSVDHVTLGCPKCFEEMKGEYFRKWLVGGGSQNEQESAQ